MLLFKFEAGIQPTPPVSPANRELLSDKEEDTHDVSCLLTIDIATEVD